MTLKRARGLVAIAACACIFTSSAKSQTACEGSTGPDVIVGDIIGPQNYSVVSGREAVSLGSYSCNMGDTNLAWIASNNHHPVIGGELYKFSTVNGAGRFEQIGLSWLKHGFFALSNTLCCTGCQGTDGSSLGVRCSDPYTAARNGSQGGLGPRWQVNAFNGVFTYPPPHPSGGNTGRIEIELADMEASSPSVRYFGNCEYITQDDAAAGNANNNCSNREMSVTGSGSAWTFGFIGVTQREIPAIKRWETVDPGAVVNAVQLGSEGLYMVGYKATSIGGGIYHYEYAVYNMNSDRCIRSFSVPIGMGANITNVGFHDVTYRGGDGINNINFDGTDWTPTITGSSVTWETDTFANNPNANALRWGTTYNFRFDSNASPVAGMATMNVFKSAGTLSAPIDTPGGAQVPGTPSCSGDGTLNTLCPCLNSGIAEHGCANSVNANGAMLTAAGTVSPDTVVMTSSGELPTSLTIFVQGPAFNANGQWYGDGLRCVTGHLRRLYAKNAVGGTVMAPTGGDPSITMRSLALGDPIAPGSTRYYFTFYRDPDMVFCPAPSGSTFNASNAWDITW